MADIDDLEKALRIIEAAKLTAIDGRDVVTFTGLNLSGVRFDRFLRSDHGLPEIKPTSLWGRIKAAAPVVFGREKEKQYPFFILYLDDTDLTGSAIMLAPGITAIPTPDRIIYEIGTELSVTNSILDGAVIKSTPLSDLKLFMVDPADNANVTTIRNHVAEQLNSPRLTRAIMVFNARNSSLRCISFKNRFDGSVIRPFHLVEINGEGNDFSHIEISRIKTGRKEEAFPPPIPYAEVGDNEKYKAALAEADEEIAELKNELKDRFGITSNEDFNKIPSEERKKFNAQVDEIDKRRFENEPPPDLTNLTGTELEWMNKDARKEPQAVLNRDGQRLAITEGTDFSDTNIHIHAGCQDFSGGNFLNSHITTGDRRRYAAARRIVTINEHTGSENIRGTEIDDLKFDYSAMDGIYIEHKREMQRRLTLRFNRASLVGVSAKKSQVMDVTLEDSDISDADFAETKFLRLRLNNTKCKNTNFDGARMEQCNFARAVDLDPVQFIHVVYDDHDIAFPNPNFHDEVEELRSRKPGELPMTPGEEKRFLDAAYRNYVAGGSYDKVDMKFHEKVDPGHSEALIAWKKFFAGIDGKDIFAGRGLTEDQQRKVAMLSSEMQFLLAMPKILEMQKETNCEWQKAVRKMDIDRADRFGGAGLS